MTAPPEPSPPYLRLEVRAADHIILQTGPGQDAPRLVFGNRCLLSRVADMTLRLSRRVAEALAAGALPVTILCRESAAVLDLIDEPARRPAEGADPFHAADGPDAAISATVATPARSPAAAREHTTAGHSDGDALIARLALRQLNQIDAAVDALHTLLGDTGTGGGQPGGLSPADREDAEADWNTILARTRSLRRIIAAWHRSLTRGQ